MVTRRRGFSFIEVLFAVAILGIGFILIAALFPVSLAQTRATNEESFAAAMSRGAQRFLEQIADESTLPPTDQGNVSIQPYVVAFRANANREAVAAEMIPSVDPRYAWLPFYSRRTGSPYATVYLFPMTVRAQSIYNQAPDVNHETTGATAGQARTLAKIGAAGIQFTNDDGSAAPGAYVLVSAMIAPPPSGGADLYHGYIYRLGNPIGDESSSTWELGVSTPFVRPYYDADGDPSTPAIQVPEINRARVFVIGRGLASQGGDPAGTKEGSGQQISSFSSVVRLRHYTPVAPTPPPGH